MISRFQNLWLNKREPQGRIEITIFFVNIFLLLCHVFLMFIYVIIGHKVMIIVNIVSLLVYLISVFNCYKNIERYMGIAFLEIWVHQIFAILAFGWRPCFQNWCFGMIAAYFMPTFKSTSSKFTIKSFFFTFCIIFTYFFLATFPPLVDIDIKVDISLEITSVLFIANNFFTFFTIMMFAHFYTSSNTRKVRELSRKADFDELTGLYNRYALNQLSTGIIKQAIDEDKTYKVAILDIDFFKKVNDTYGHASGDMVLKELAKILKFYAHDGVVCGRWGGEEFIMMATCDKTYKQFEMMLERLKIKVSKYKFLIEDNKKINLTISIGAKEIPNDKLLDEAVSMADENLYEAKESGRNRLISK